MDLFDLQDEATERNIPQYEWMKSKNFVLGTTENISEIIDTCISAGRYALDLETTGLNVSVYDGLCTKDRIVGVCLSPDGNTGYYIPVRHKEPHEHHNVPWSVVHREMKRLVDSDSVAIFHNGSFDAELLQFNGTGALGEWDRPRDFEDTLILAYLADTKRKRKGLKYLSKELLGMEMIELKELMEALADPSKKKPDKKVDYDFSRLDPSWKYTLLYAGADAICTYLLYDNLAPLVLNPSDGQQSQKTIYRIEKGCQAATRWMERARVRTDRKKVEELIQIGQRDWFQCLHEVYEEVEKALGRDVRPGWFRVFCGDIDGLPPFDADEVDIHYPFNTRVKDTKKLADKRRLDAAFVNVDKIVPSLTDHNVMETVSFPAIYDVGSASQLGVMLRELGVKGLEVTEKSGQVKTSNDVLTRIIENATDLVYMKKIEKFRSNAKALSTYVLPLYEDARSTVEANGETIWCVRAGFNAYSADTGRFTARTSRRPKEDGGTRLTFHGLPSGYKKGIPEALSRIKEVLIPREGKINVSIDYSGVELRVVTALSKEPLWMDQYFLCSSCGYQFERPEERITPTWIPPFCPDCGSDKIGDIHTLTAQSVYGKDVLDRKNFKELRQKAKGANFALCYGGSGRALERSIGVDENEGQRIKRKFDKSYITLQAWWARMKSLARKYGYVTTALGRRCSLMPDIKMPKTDPDSGRNNMGFINKALRCACNYPIQGTSADITKSSMFFIYKECKKRGWLDKVHMLGCIHDELVFEIDLDILEKALEMIEEQMARNPLIMGLKWPVPLMLDTEIGFSWKTPWNLAEFKIGKKPWPDEIKKYFTKHYMEYDAPPSMELPEGSRIKLEIGASTPEVLEAVAEAVAVTESTTGPYYSDTMPESSLKEYTVSLPSLSTATAVNLAQLVHEIQNTGVTRIKFSYLGKDVTEQFESHWGGPLRASMRTLQVMGRKYGIV